MGDKYKATVSSEILARYTLVNGTFVYQFLATLPATAGAWNTFSQSVTIPASTTAMTLFHVLPRIGTLSVDDVNVLGVTTPPTDTTKPTVSITSPLSSTTASGTISVQATATDNIGVTSVTLLIDGVVVGSQDTTAPFTFAWDTASVNNATHTISARAVDAAGNTQDATAVTVIVNNSITPPSNNLVLNPALEIAGTAGNPQNWNRGGWGTNNRIFTYPVAGITGNAAQIDITTYTNGDAKWYFDPVFVNPGETYTFNYSYKSSTTTNITLRYTNIDGTFTYLGMSNPGAVANWTNASFTFVPPTGVTAVSVMHIINKIGTLAIDNYSLVSGNTNTFSKGKVSLSFDDGWLEHDTVARPILDAAGIKGTFYIVSNEMAGAIPTERVSNSTLETVAAGGDPQNWNRGGWGTNDRVYTYPVAGTSGNAVQVAITTYTNGDAKWYGNDVSVATSTKYVVGDSYKSNVPTEVLARFMLSDGTFFYQFLSQLPSTTNAWSTFSQTITTPANAVSLTLFHVLPGVGVLGIDNMSIKPIQVFATTAQVQELASSGHEIGAHSRTHTSLISLNTSGKTSEISGSRQDLLNAGFAPVSTFAYPYGDYDPSVQTVTANAGFTLGRSVVRGYNDSTTDHFALKIQQVSRDRTMAEMKGWIDQAAVDRTWLIFMFHQISDDPTNSPLGISPADFQTLVSYLQTANVDKITVAEGASLLL